MKKTALTLSVALAALLAGSAFAQPKVGANADAQPGSTAMAKSATASEKAAAKEMRKAEGSKAAKAGDHADAQPGSTAMAKSATASEKAAAKAKRRAEGAAAAKGEKEKSGGN